MNNISDLGVIGLAFLTSLVIAWLMFPPFINLMEKYRILDKAGGRKIHTGYTAHMGGIVIGIAYGIGLLSMVFAYRQEVAILRVLFFAIMLGIMLFVGIRDDMNNLTPRMKLFFEIAVGIGMAFCGLKITDFTLWDPASPIHIPEWMSYIITIVVFVVICNAYNLIDGIDGQAGMQAIATLISSFIFLYLYVRGTWTFELLTPTFVMLSCAAMMGAICGFLRFNWQKARVFMGDTGSLLIGTMLTINIIICAKYAFAVTYQSGVVTNPLKAVVMPFFCIFFLPLADTLRVFIGRVRRGKSPFDADKTHFHHLCIRFGYSHQGCTMLSFTISIGVSILAAILAHYLTDLQMLFAATAGWFLFVWIVKSRSRIRMKQLMRKNKEIK